MQSSEKVTLQQQTNVNDCIVAKKGNGLNLIFVSFLDD
jgi:hypothetical protein